jgi:hypothetical protein
MDMSIFRHKVAAGQRPDLSRLLEKIVTAQAASPTACTLTTAPSSSVAVANTPEIDAFLSLRSGNGIPTASFNRTVAQGLLTSRQSP